MSSISTIIGLCLLFFILSNVDVNGQKCSPVFGNCNMHSDCCSGKCLTYGSRCGYPAHRLKKTYLSADEFQSIKRQSASSFNDEVKVIGLPSESEPSNVVFKIDSPAKCRNVGEPSQIEALPAGKDSSGKDAKLPLISKPPLQQQLNPLNQDEVTMFTNMFLSLFRGVADYRNMVAADSVQSVWQSPPVVDFSHRLFAS
ncbi:GD18507 [Drosophila simulans]|uniref:GD18507 n=1 Tax=Drosophila simulans TaxID=7240 RepID=B4QZ82_DROSI|nr:GD18507 [Drosophila simulans]